MRGILIAAGLVLVLAGVGAAGYVATKDDDGTSPSSRNLLAGPSPSPPDSAPASPASPDSTTAPDNTPTSPTAPAEPASPAAPTDTSPASPPAPSRVSGKRRVFTVPPAHHFSGTGNKRLGTVDLRATSILRWRAKGHFEVRFGRQDFAIIAPTKSGQLIVPAFRFDRVRVVASGRWRITVTPQT